MVAGTEEAGAQVQNRTIPYRSSLRYTNFYPLYDSANDQVDPILKAQPVQFQRVLPRYRLSTSETRDLGVGPMFTEVPAVSVGQERETGISNASRDDFRGPAKQVEPRAAVLESWKGSQVDLFA